MQGRARGASACVRRGIYKKGEDTRRHLTDVEMRLPYRDLPFPLAGAAEERVTATGGATTRMKVVSMLQGGLSAPPLTRDTCGISRAARVYLEYAHGTLQ